MIVPFAAGILLSIAVGKPGFNLNFLIPGILLALLASALLSHFYATFRWRWLTGLSIYLLLFFTGFSFTMVKAPWFSENHFQYQKCDKSQYLVRISEPPLEKENSYRIVAKVENLSDSTGWRKVTGSVLLYFEKDDRVKMLNYGDILLVEARIDETKHPTNPHQFDFKKYLANNGIYHQGYVRADQWKNSGENRASPVYRFSYQVQQSMMKILADNELKGDEFAVATAILLGYDENMEPELRQNYAGSGALHVLCVSGLHVGIVFFIMSFLLSPLNRRKKTRFVKVLILMSSVWLYAFITGLSPSVMRASVMFSLFALREGTHSKTNPYNVVAGSAFILLMINPFLITKVGFQLSYSAVIGIIALFNPLYRLMAFKNPVADYVWSLVVVSVAAQIGTFPVSVFYFHQFPLYFLLTNLIVIPMVWLIIYTGIIVLGVSVVWQFLALKISLLLSGLIWLMNTMVAWINSLPEAVIDGLTISMFGVVLIYLFFILITRFFVTKKSGFLVGGLSLLCVLAGMALVRKYSILNQQKLVVYDARGHSVIDFFAGNKVFSLSDTAAFIEERPIDFAAKNNRVFSGGKMAGNFLFEIPEIEENTDKNIYWRSRNFFTAGGFTIAIVDRNFPNYKPQKPLPVDYVILRGNPRLGMDELKQLFDFKMLVFDSSNSRWNVKKWIEACKKMSIPFYDVGEEGAFVADSAVHGF